MTVTFAPLRQTSTSTVRPIGVSATTRGTVRALFQVSLLLYTLFFLLSDGEALLRRILYYLPLDHEDERRMLDRFTSVTRATLKGTLLIGLAQGALDMAIKHVKGRKQFGRPIGAFQATQFKIAEMATKVETARAMVYKSAWLLDQGKPDTKLTAMAKLYACHVAVEVVDEALQLHGGYGYFNDYDIERFYRAAKVLEIYEGTKEVEKIVISREILGKL